MRAKSFALLVLALGCGLVASIGITQVMSKEGPPPAPAGDTETVFVATEEIAMGDPLEPSMLRLEQWPKDKIPEGALTKIEDVEGRFTRTVLYAGEPVLEKKLYPKGTEAAGPSGRIPEGYRLATVKVDSTSGAHGMIFPGDRVDVQVYVQKNACQGVVESGVYTILQDIKVFACNDVIEPDSTEGGAKSSIKAQTISLLVTPQQAKKVQLAAKLGDVSLVLRSREDSEQAPDEVVTVSDLFDGSEVANREKEVPNIDEVADNKPSGLRAFLDRLSMPKMHLQPPTPPATFTEEERIETWTMRIARGPEIEQVLLEAEEEPTGTKTWKISMPGTGPFARSANSTAPPHVSGSAAGPRPSGGPQPDTKEPPGSRAPDADQPDGQEPQRPQQPQEEEVEEDS